MDKQQQTSTTKRASSTILENGCEQPWIGMDTQRNNEAE